MQYLQISEVISSKYRKSQNRHFFLKCLQVSKITFCYRLIKILQLLQDDWPEGYQLAVAMNFKFQQCVPIPFATVVNSVGDDGLKLMTDMMLWNPEKRPSAISVSKFCKTLN